jgi:uncharacterized membrane protein YjgN (DUF898 family)
MDEMPDYSKYTLDQLQDVYDHLDWKKYPDEFNIVLQEIKKKKALSPIAVPEIQPNELVLQFRGSAHEYFRIWIVNLCLTLLTLGIFSAWAKVRKKRYFYSHTILDNTPFQYLGQPIPILKGRVIAAVLFLIYYASSHFFTSLLPYVLVAGILLAPWVVVRSAAFNARYSAFRNMTFQFHGKYLDAFKVLYAWGLLPAFVISITFNWWGHYNLMNTGGLSLIGIVFLVFGLAFPWWIRNLKNFIVSYTFYGGKKGTFSATGGQFFKVYFVSGLIVLTFAITAVIIVAILSSAFEKQNFFLVFMMMVPIYTGYVLAYAYVQAHTSNLVWNHTRLGPLRFESSLFGWGLTKLYLSNAVGIIVSLGLLIPWAVMRTLKYRAENMRVFKEGDLAEFQGGKTSIVQAAGAETMDFFDVDFSL